MCRWQLKPNELQWNLLRLSGMRNMIAGMVPAMWMLTPLLSIWMRTGDSKAYIYIYICVYMCMYMYYVV